LRPAVIAQVAIRFIKGLRLIHFGLEQGFEQREHVDGRTSTFDHQSYLDLCAGVEREGKGRISDPALLLDYLHNIGTVFYREGLFGDRIILD
jgi:hypothetical protein